MRSIGKLVLATMCLFDPHAFCCVPEFIKFTLHCSPRRQHIQQSQLDLRALALNLVSFENDLINHCGLTRAERRWCRS
eukprot:c41862_g1_i1 orf=361-594(+)